MNFTRASPQSRGRFAASARHSRRRCRARVVVRSPVSFGRAASLAAARGAVTGAVAAGEDGAGASSGVPGTGLGGGAGDAAGGGAGAGDPAGAPCAPAARGDSSATASNPSRAVCRRYGPAPNAASNECMAFLPFEQPQGRRPGAVRTLIQRTARQAFIGPLWQAAAHQAGSALGGRPEWRAHLPIPCGRVSTRLALRP
jgi:hypothetical protein